MSLHVVLELLFPGVRIPAIDIENADWITNAISLLWLESKVNGKEHLGPQNETLLELRSRLQKWMPGVDSNCTCIDSVCLSKSSLL